VRELYDPRDPALTAERRRARLLFKALNDTRDDEQDERNRLIRELIPASGRDVWIEPPFYCDYRSNITLGDAVFFNFNCVVLDVAPVRIGSRVLFGPAVQVYAATHPLSAGRAGRGLSRQNVEIGDDTWIAAGPSFARVRMGRSTVGAARGPRNIPNGDWPRAIRAASCANRD